MSIRKSIHARVLGHANELINKLKIQRTGHIYGYVRHLAELRAVRCEVMSLRDLRYPDLLRLGACEAQLLNF